MRGLLAPLAPGLTNLPRDERRRVWHRAMYEAGVSPFGWTSSLVLGVGFAFGSLVFQHLTHCGELATTFAGSVMATMLSIFVERIRYRAVVPVIRRVLVREGRCPSCGYDRHATPARCPECGETARF